MDKQFHKFYLITLGVLLALSSYPIIMGVKIIILQLQNGSIGPEDYARYVIPYTAICISILISAALLPIILRFRRFSNLIATVLGLGLFVGIELPMESITVRSPFVVQSAVDLQLFSCVGTSAAVQAFQKPYSDAYKIHYFLVSFVIITLVISIVYGHAKLILSGNRANKIPLRMRFTVTAILLLLCIFANVTGFFRDTTQYLSPLSAFLTGTFFIVLGAASGIYAGSYLIDKNKILSLISPAITAMLICSIMYYGEFRLLDGKLYRFGNTFLFEPMPNVAVSPVDIIIILFSGIITALIVNAARRKHSSMLISMHQNHTFD
ncbi:MAG: hypothetical protein N2645_03650 [Clostridia bacterium]|nr:hypothetical protein [Clostridia bacterium]